MPRWLVALACLSLAAPVARAVEPAPPATAVPAPTATSAAGSVPSAVPAPAATPDATASAPVPTPGQPVVVLLKDGQKLKGKLVSQDAGGVTIESSGALMQFPAASVQALAVPGSDAAEGAWPRDPNRTRYLYSPTGFMLQQGEGYVSQTELLLTTVGFGLTDWLTVQAGTVIPVLFYEPSSTPFILALKVGGSPSEHVHLAGGFQAFAVPGLASGTAGLLFATVTLGTENANLGVSAGPPFSLGGGTSELGKVVVSVSGNLRVSRSIALVSENWFVQVEGSTEVVGSAAVRFIGDRLGVDAGLIFSPGSSFPVPWLDFTWHFGDRPR
jgi:hypothetical protein